MVEDHRERKAPLFDVALAQDATNYWLPEDTNTSPARHMTKPGPLPDGALTERPAKTDAELLAGGQGHKDGRDSGWLRCSRGRVPNHAHG